MLVGGVRLLGLYQYGPDGGAPLDALRKSAAAVHAALAETSPEMGSEWLVLHIPFGARKYVCKNLDAAAAGAKALKPAEWKFQPLGKTAFHSFSATIRIHLRAPIGVEAEAAAVQDALRAAAAAHCEAYQRRAALTIDGRSADPGAALSSLAGGTAAAGCSNHAVEMFAPDLGRPVGAVGTGGGDVAEVFGTLLLRCVLHERGTVGDALALLWQDLALTLRARLDLHGEMLLASEGGAEPARASFGTPTPLPRRVLIDAPDTISGVDCGFADHLYAEDGYVDVAERAGEVLGLSLVVGQGDEAPSWALAEEPATAATQADEPVEAEASPEAAGGSGGGGGALSPAVLGAGAVVVLLAVLAATQLQ